MFQDLDLFRTAFALSRHAGQQQAVAATNIANADTPGFRAQRLGAFEEAFRSGGDMTLRATRPGHLQADAASAEARLRPAATQASPNGNTVSLEEEMLASVEADRAHNRALAVYKHSLTVLRHSIGRG